MAVPSAAPSTDDQLPAGIGHGVINAVEQMHGRYRAVPWNWQANLTPQDVATSHTIREAFRRET